MQIAVIGAGYVGLMQASGLAEAGYRVACIDIDVARVAKLNAGELPIYEPDLPELVEKHLGDKLTFTAVYNDLAEADIFFVCVQTPQNEDGSCNVDYVSAALKDIGEVAKEGALVVIKSTTPPGTVNEFRASLNRQDLSLAVNPEFLRQGKSVNDFFHPQRTLLGVESHADEKVLRDIYSFLDAPVFVTNIPSAQISKYAANTMLALRLSYINEVANIAQVTGGRIKDIEAVVGSDPRIGADFLRSGAGFGGSCFPKDVLALHEAGKKNGYESRLIAPIIEINHDQPNYFLENLEQHVSLSGTKVAVWGLSFNKGTDDVRESPAIRIVKKLLERGAHVTAHDPEAIENAKRELGEHERMNYVVAKEEALPDAEALLVLTEWDEYLEADYEIAKSALAKPVIGDGKHVLDYWGLRKQGFTVVGIGL